MELEEDSVKLSLYVWLSQPGVSLSSPFFDHARTVGEGRGPCVVDMKPERMYEYARGFHHFIADMRGLPLVDASALEEFVKAQEIREMMAMRDECVNMKKVLLHLQHYAKNLLVQLRRLSICFYAGRNVDGSLKEAAKVSLETLSKAESGRGSEVTPTSSDFTAHEEIGVSLNTCKGLVSGINDARQVMKAICCVPRHPQDYSQCKSQKLRDMPLSLFPSKALSSCQHILRSYRPQCAGSFHHHSLKYTPSGTRLQRLFSAVDAFISEQGCAPEAACAFYMKQSLIARGVTKAFYVVEEVENYVDSLSALMRDYELALQELTAIKESYPYLSGSMDPADKVMVQVYIARFTSQRDVMTSLLPVLQRLLREKGAVPLFRGGDDIEVGDRVPSEFAVAQRLSVHEEVIQRYAGRMERVLEALDVEKQATFLRGDSRCFRCRRKFHHLWVIKKVCFWCVKSYRNQRRCPFRDKCSVKSFCPHTSECFLCDARSCEECRFFQGNGQDVLQLLRQRQHQLDAIYLDFDRTICTTRNGLSPLEGNHFVEPALLEVLMGNYPNLKELAIVTKNSHVDDIREFLATHGVPRSLTIRCVRGISKANAFNVAPRSVIVDDDINELTDTHVERKNVLRFLYHPTKR